MNLLSRPRNMLRTFRDQAAQSRRAATQLDDIKLLTARGLIHQLRSAGILQNIQDAEFKVFSQFGDDGIIQYLLLNIPDLPPSFVEFGVENYIEANTRFLLVNNNWRGLVMDGSAESMAFVQQGDIYWRHELTAVSAFVDRDNINGLLRSNGFSGPLGLLHIDIDGNDYWVWERIEVVDPVIVVVEFNSVFGAQHAITVPYDPQFQRTRAHSSNLYWGASLKALCLLANKKGYVFVGCNSAGNNAYFVKRERVGRMRVHEPESGYVLSRFRESRRPNGSLSFVTGDERLRAIEDMPVHDVETNRQVILRDLRVGSGGA